jgi:hypothetical protein
MLLLLSIVLLSLGIAVALLCLQNHLSGKATRTRLIFLAIFLILLLTAPRYIVWNTITLMENALWSTLLLVTSVFVIQDHPSSWAINQRFIPLMILLILTRPESGLWVIVFLSVLFLRLTTARGTRSAFQELIPSMVTFLLCIAILTLFRLAYFGYSAPNTFYAKVSPSLVYNVGQGLGYLAGYVVSDPIVFLTIIAIGVSGTDVIVRILKKQISSDGWRYLPLIAAAGLFLPLITGGDHFGSFRLYQSIYPIQLMTLLLFASQLLTTVPASVSPHPGSGGKQAALRYAAAGLGILLLPFQWNTWGSIQTELAIEFRVAEYGRKNGAFIQDLFGDLPGLPSLGVVTSGGIKYAYEGEVVDLMGLNNTVMAHNGGDRKGIKNHAAFHIPTFYQLSPDIVWPLTVVAANWEYSYPEVKESWENREGFKGLFDQPRFLASYSYAKVSGSDESGYALVGWFRKDFLEGLPVGTDLLVEEYPYSIEPHAAGDGKRTASSFAMLYGATC